MEEPTSLSHPTCPNCGAVRPTLHCGECGQHERGSRRLTVRDLIGHVVEVLFDLESAFPATVRGLWTHPGRVCRDYVAGKRRSYLNPFAYLLVAITVQIAIEFLVARIRNDPKPAGDLPNDVLTWALLAGLVPLAVIWVWMFRPAGFNLAENYVMALYLAAQFSWVEAFLSPVSLLTTNEALTSVGYCFVWLGLATWTGVEFYRMKWPAVLWRMILSTALALFAVIVVVVVIDGIARLAGATGFLN